MADWASILRSLGLGTGPLPPPGNEPPQTVSGPVLPPATMGFPPGMGQAATGMGVQQLIQQALNKSRMFENATHESPVDPHPADLPEGLIEQLIKGAGIQVGRLIPEDKPYLEQYLHPERDILPRTDLRPTRGGPPAPMVHRRPSEDDRWQLSDIANMPQRIGHTSEPSLGGLGKATLSEGPDYLSVYDKWDFDSPSNMLNEGTLPEPVRQALDWIIKQGMSQVGEPFAVYERYDRPPRPMPSHTPQK